MTKLLLRGGTLVGEDGLVRADLRVSAGRIIELGPDLGDGSQDERSVDCEGLYVLPGLIDFHVHVDDRIGRYRLADSWSSASLAALPTGITTFLSFATQGRGSVDGAVEAMLDKAGGSCHCDHHVHFTPTSWDKKTWADVASLARAGFRTIKLYTTYKSAGLYVSYPRLEEILRRCADLDITALVHCEDEALLEEAAKGQTGADPADAHLHARLRPARAEIEAVERALEAARKSGARLHVVHVSTAQAAKMLCESAETKEVTFETCPQYLVLDESELRGRDGHRYLCSPPLRRREEAAGLRHLVAQGQVDVLATDHCAFSKEDKDAAAGVDIRKVPCGFAGIGALAALSRELFVDDFEGNLVQFVRMLSTNPARIAGLRHKGSLREGADADIVCVDPRGNASPVRSTLAGAHETYPGFTARWSVERVYLRGRLVVRRGALVDEQAARGEAVWRK